MKLAPASKIPGEKTCYYQPYLKLPEPFARNIFKKDDVTDLTKLDREYVLKTVEKSNYGFFEPFEINKYTIFYNAGGGAQWTGASVDPYKNILYVTANNIAWRVGVIPYENRRMINGQHGVRRFCVDLDFQHFKGLMVKLFKGIKFETWLHVEDYDGFLKKMEDYKKEYCFDDT